jgi:hypothetical protein
MTAANIHGAWADGGEGSGLIGRVRHYWYVPIEEPPNSALAPFLRQRIAIDPVLAEARQRLASGRVHDSGLYEGELAAAVESASHER